MFMGIIYKALCSTRSSVLYYARDIFDKGRKNALKEKWRTVSGFNFVSCSFLNAGSPFQSGGGGGHLHVDGDGDVPLDRE